MRYELVKAHSSVARVECADKIKMFVYQIHNSVVQVLFNKLGLLSAQGIYKYLTFYEALSQTKMDIHNRQVTASMSKQALNFNMLQSENKLNTYFPVQGKSLCLSLFTRNQFKEFNIVFR